MLSSAVYVTVWIGTDTLSQITMKDRLNAEARLGAFKRLRWRQWYNLNVSLNIQ